MSDLTEEPTKCNPSQLMDLDLKPLYSSNKQKEKLAGSIVNNWYLFLFFSSPGFDISYCVAPETGAPTCEVFKKFHEVVEFSEQNSAAGFRLVRMHGAEKEANPQARIDYGVTRGTLVL